MCELADCIKIHRKSGVEDDGTITGDSLYHASKQLITRVNEWLSRGVNDGLL